MFNPTPIYQDFIVVQEKEPTSPFNGQIWVRSSDGSTFQYFNGWEQIGQEPDNNTIIVNEDGKLTAINNRVFGHFGTDLGEWTHTNISGSVFNGTSDMGVFGYYGSLDFGANMEGEELVERDINLEGAHNILIALKVEDSSSASNDEFWIEVDGNTVANFVMHEIIESGDEGWYIIETDSITDYEGTHTVGVRYYSDGTWSDWRRISGITTIESSVEIKPIIEEIYANSKVIEGSGQ